MICEVMLPEQPHEFIPTRRSLLSRLRNHGDDDSWREFFDTYWRLIYAQATKSGLNDADAQEVVQETVIAIARKIKDFQYDKTKGKFKGWLLHTTRWKIHDQLRKKQRDGLLYAPRQMTSSSRTATLERMPGDAGDDLEATWDRDFKRSQLDEAIRRVKGKVKAKQYQIFDLYVNREWPVKKVAETLGINVGSVYLAKHRVGNLLKKEIKQLERKFV